ncbi:restriction endonuclease subunit S [bacterium]|nr:restriction endonuclease subunit S [bacterium]
MSEWQRIRLGDYAETFAGGTPDRGNAAFFGGTIPWVKSTEVNLDRIRKTEEFLTEDGFHSSAAKWIPSRTVLVALYGATAAQIAYLEIAATANQAVLAVIPNEHIDSVFLFYALTAIKEKILFQAQGSGQPNLNKQIIDRITVDLPPLFEQRRIAEILSTLDEAIEQTEALLAKHRQIKAGLMHDLFTRGVTPDGRLRLTREQAPDLYKESPLGWIPKDWEVGTLSQYLDPLAGIKPGPFGSSLTKDNYVSSGFRVYGQEQVIAGSLEIGDYYITEAKYLEMAAFEVLADDVLISLVGTVGCVLVVKPPFERGIINPRLMRLRPARGVVLSGFLRHLLLSANVRRQLEIFAGGGTMPVINGKIIRRLIIPLLSLDEQAGMVERIDALDDIIASASAALAKLRQQKHGLMHDLLTGRVRVMSPESEPAHA